MKLLIVDDEELIRNVIKEYLLNEGYKVLEAKDGFDALRVISDNKVDLIVLDIMMPKMDGFTCLSEIRKTKNIPVIMLNHYLNKLSKVLYFQKII